MNGLDGSGGPASQPAGTGSGPSQPGYRLVFESYTNPRDTARFRVQGADPADSAVRITGAFPKFSITWSPDFKVHAITVEVRPFTYDGPIYQIFVDNGSALGCDPYILPAVVYGAYNVPATHPGSMTLNPSPAITIGNGSDGHPVVFLNGREVLWQYLTISLDGCDARGPLAFAEIKYKVLLLDLNKPTDAALCNGPGKCFAAAP